jgi:hypothetical protein
MSYATLLGGTCTLIGTSTNLVVSGLQEARYGANNPEYVFGFFSITPWGIPYAVWGKCLQIAFCKPRMSMQPAQSTLITFCLGQNSWRTRADINSASRVHFADNAICRDVATCLTCVQVWPTSSCSASGP